MQVTLVTCEPIKNYTRFNRLENYAGDLVTYEPIRNHTGLYHLQNNKKVMTISIGSNNNKDADQANKRIEDLVYLVSIFFELITRIINDNAF